VLAGCASLVGAEEATLVQGTGGTAGAGGGQGGSAGEAGAAGGGGGPETVKACPGSDVVDVAFNDLAIYVLCGDHKVMRVRKEKLEAEPASIYPAIARNLAFSEKKVIGLLDIGGKTLMSWEDNPPGGQSNVLNIAEAGPSSNLATPGGDTVFVATGDMIKQASLADGVIKDIASPLFEISFMVSDPAHIYVVGRNVGAAAIDILANDTFPLDLLVLGKDPVHVALRPGGALFVAKGISKNNGKISFYSPANGGSLTVVVDNLSDPAEASSGLNGDIYFIEDPTGLGRISRRTEETKDITPLIDGQNGARALRVIEPYVYWGMPDGTLRRVQR